MLGKKFVDIEEKYELPQKADGFSEEGEENEAEENVDESEGVEDSEEV